MNRETLDLLIALWLVFGAFNWLMSAPKASGPAWTKFVIGLPVCALVGPIPLIPYLLGIGRRKR